MKGMAIFFKEKTPQNSQTTKPRGGKITEQSHEALSLSGTLAG
jgi:hypothetical protein